MIITTYTCDKCDHEQEEPKQMWDIGIVAREKTDSRFPASYLSTPKEHALWCQSCLVELGLLPPAKNDPPKPTPAPTFEDMIREIVYEEVSNTV